MTRTETLNYIKSQYSIAKFQKNTRDSCKEQLDFLYQGLTEFQEYQKYNDRVQEDTKEEMTEFKKKRLALVESNTQSNIDEVFPNRNFKVKFEPDTSYGTEVLELLIGENGRLDPTEMQNGRCLRQVVNISISTTIQIIQGCKIFIFDEAANSSDPETVTLISQIIQFLIDHGFQVIMIEHQRALYKNLKRKQFNIVLNAKKEVEVESVHVY